MIEDLITRTLILVFGYAYPAFQCFKTLQKNKVGVPELRFWCQYWVIIALFSILERFLDIFVSWLPFYRWIKFLLYIYLWHPGTKGSTYMYETVVQPYVSKHESKIDRGIAELKERAWNLALSYWYNCADMSSKKALSCMQLLMTQMMNAALSRPQPQEGQAQENNDSGETPTSTPSTGIFKRNVSEKKKPPVVPPGTNGSPTPKSDSFKVKLNNQAQFIRNNEEEAEKTDGDTDFQKVRLRRINSKE